MLINNKCFCGSNEQFFSCCQQFINQNDKQRTFPETPEALMRSRFSAYAIGNGQYIYDTYATTSQASQSIKEINDWSQACVWVALQIHSINNGDLTKHLSSEQFVEFSAFYITENTLCVLRENSRFILQSTNSLNDNQKAQWRYIDGDIIEHVELAGIKRKDICPCNDYPTSWSMKKGKKFKQCCGK